MTDSLPSIPQLERTDFVREPYDIALLIDNVVYQLINLDGQAAAQYMSNPTFVQVDYRTVSNGDVYDPATGTFSKPQVI